MSKSKKLPIYKDRGIAQHSTFRRKIKRRIRQKVKELLTLLGIESYELPSPKVLVNDYDWCDYICDYIFDFRFDFRFKSQSRYIRDTEKYDKYMEESQIRYSRK